MCAILVPACLVEGKERKMYSLIAADGTKIALENGSTILGRGELLGISDKRCSRKQLELNVELNGRATVTVV